MITVSAIIFVKPEPLEIKDEKSKLPPLRVALYLVLFALAIAIVFRGIPYVVGLVVIPLVLIFADRDALKKVDYPLAFHLRFLLHFCREYGKD